MKFFVCGFVMMLFMASAFTAQAAVIIDPNAGWEGYFNWLDGAGPIDEIYSNGYSGPLDPDAVWKVTVPVDSIMTFAAVNDIFGTPAGDQFALVVDGAIHSWDDISWIKDSEPGVNIFYFYGTANDIYLSAGTHTLSFNVTALASAGATIYSSGTGFASFSSLTPALVTPLPSALWFLGSGVTAMLCLRKRNA